MTKSPLNHIVVVLAILTATAAVYCHVTASYYCNDDDFMEVHRAAFVDARDPMMMFTTVHFGFFRYRPLSRAMTLLTYLAGHGRPEAFRVRNLAFHLLNVALVYFLALVFRKPVAVAAMASTLFAVHPLANLTVVGAVVTNTAADSMYILAIILLAMATFSTNRQVLYMVFTLNAVTRVPPTTTVLSTFARKLPELRFPASANTPPLTVPEVRKNISLNDSYGLIGRPTYGRRGINWPCV